MPKCRINLYICHTLELGRNIDATTIIEPFKQQNAENGISVSPTPGDFAHSMLFCAPVPAPENEGKW